MQDICKPIGNTVYYVVGRHVVGALWDHLGHRDHLFERIFFLVGLTCVFIKSKYF